MNKNIVEESECKDRELNTAVDLTADEDLTEEEKMIIAQGREEYLKDNYISLAEM